jgi:hypothetical protein
MIFIFIFTACATNKTATEATTEITIQETKTIGITAKNKIVFNSDRDGNSEIYMMNIDGSGQTRLTNNPASDMDPSFSP